MYILYIQRKGTTQVEKLSSHYNNNLYCCYYEPKNNKLYNKNMGELKWELIKRNCKIINYSENFKNFNKTNYYFTEINNSLFQKITASKLKEENEIEIKSFQNEKERKEIINNLKLNIETNFDNNIKINYLNKKRRRKKAKKLKFKKIKNKNVEIETDSILLKNDLKYNEKELSDDNKDKNTEINIINIKNNKNIERGIMKKKYIESGNIIKFNELIPDLSELEKQYIIKDNEHYSLSNDTKNVLLKLLGIKNKVEIIDRNFIILNTISFDKNYLLLYFQLTKKEVLLVSRLTGELQFYDLINNIILDPIKSLNIIKDLIDMNVIMGNYIAYLLNF